MDAGCEENYPWRTPSDSRERGIALLLALIIILIISGLAVSLVLLTDSQVRLGQTAQAQGRVFYAALAGLEEARGRMNGSAPDTIAPSLPTSISQVLYIVNSSSSDPVQPTNLASPYFDSEYSTEFPGGFASASVLPSINSDQPGAGTSTVIPYKWVRITLMTEASAHMDINQDGVLNSTAPIYWDGTRQSLSSAGGTLVFVLTALAVDSTKVMKILRTEVAGTPGSGSFAPLAPMATTSSISVTGNSSSPNIFVDGTDHNTGGGGCPAPAAALPGILSGGAATVSWASVTGNPATLSNVGPFPQSVSSLLSQFQTSAIAITSVDPSHVTSSGTGYTAHGTTLGTQPSGGNPGTVAVVYADNSLTISGGGNSGYGLLLVNGNLTVIGDFNYQGVMIVNGQVNFTPSPQGTIAMSGAVLGAGVVTLNASSGLMNPQINTWYNSCVVARVLQGISGGIPPGSSSPTTSPQVLSYRELSY